jgi:hypothetical protein
MPRPTIAALQATVAEQEATILRLRSENSQLLAKLASMRKTWRPRGKVVLSTRTVAQLVGDKARARKRRIASGLAALGVQSQVASAFIGRRRTRIPLPKAPAHG